MDILSLLAQEFKLNIAHARNIVELIDSGNTIPFIARYRKEMTGSCDDQILRELADRMHYLRNLEKRKAEVTEAITAQEKMTDEIRSAIDMAQTLAGVEDIYRPYRPKRRTRATAARERGLEPLAGMILLQRSDSLSPEKLALPFIDNEKGVGTWEDAIAGASDIIAEDMSDDAQCRGRIRDIVMRGGTVTSTAKREEDSVYRMYYGYSEPVPKIPSHRILAINRGEREEYLRVSIEINPEQALDILKEKFVKPGSATTECVVSAAEDALERLIMPSVEREARAELTSRASEQAIRTFAMNLKPLLLQPPLRDSVIMGFDPAYRTGCKIAVIDKTGRVLDTTVVYPMPPQKKTEEAREILSQLIKKHGISVISIGNGTASKESEMFISEIIHDLGGDIRYIVVSEAGASVYSASKLAASEFPDFDVSLRSAVSIARRLQDPLAELVKIDPKSIGVGQYQHDMPPARLDEALGGVVEDCVNSVGVDVNTASAQLLTYVSGVGAAVAKNIVAFRDENGGFSRRSDIKKVPKLGPKAYEQCAGFLRIPGGQSILDNTSVHPESYEAAEGLLKTLDVDISDAAELLMLPSRALAYGDEKLAAELRVGMPTLRDIITELQKPGRDIRSTLPAPLLRTDIMELRDLKPGMELRGTVRNVTDFGAFVDIGVHEDGLAHISELSDRYIRHPSEAVRTGDVVTARVLSVDIERKRVSLSLKNLKND